MTHSSQPLKVDGFDEAIIGTDCRTGNLIYSMRKCVRVLRKRDRMGYQEAIEYLEFNVTCAYMGEGTPIFLNDHE